MTWPSPKHHLVKQWEGHDEKERSEEEVEEPLLVLAEPSELLQHIIEVLGAWGLSTASCRGLHLLGLPHGSNKTASASASRQL